MKYFAKVTMKQGSVNLADLRRVMRKRAVFFFVALMMSFSLPAIAQPAAPIGDGETVFAVLFYSPSCPHCHTVIDEDLPVIYDEFGDGLQVLFVDVTTQGGSALFSATCDALDTNNQCGGVPMMAIGDVLLFGALQIPQQLPGLVRAGLADDGIGLPPVPLLEQAYAESFPAADDSETVNGRDSEAISTSSTATASVWDHLASDPVANAAAVIVLAALLLSLLVASVYQQQNIPEIVLAWGPRIIVSAGVLVGVSLVSASSDDMLGSLISIAVLVLLAATTVMIVKGTPHQRIIPVVALAGLAVAGYLFHVESTGSEAMCGAVGNCNAVQQSDYAMILGVPVGLLGIIGYALILLVWAADQMTNRVSRYPSAALLFLAVVGTLFSAYLTFLEPFVIGATCAWCLTSAITMLLLLWLVVDEGWASWLQLAERNPA